MSESEETKLWNEWQQLLEEYGLDELQRWFVSFKGYKANREHRDYEAIKQTLEKLVI